MSRSLMVIGGSGFFGKSILDAFARGFLAPWAIDRILVVARSASRLSVTHPSLVGAGVELINADVGTAASLPFADYVIHAASTTDAQRYIDDPLGERANILAAIDNYARIARACHADSRIIYTSSGAVYGQQPPELDLLPETFDPGEASGLVAYKRDYAEAKRLAEARIAALGEHGIRTSVARCFAFVGVHLPRDQHFAIGNFLADGLAGRPVRVNARKPVYRSYMHADDLVVWLLTIAAAADLHCPTWNVGSDEAVTMGDAAEAVARRCGVPALVPAWSEPGEDRYVPSIAKAREALGLALAYDLESAIDDVVRRVGSAEPLAAAGASDSGKGR
ncbi:NAD-dependent epimerase/dehydratase family protein [Sphingomonas jatrophae]|uniref:dTDP-glucose 4,6-dehydratase n=1 Tax=Sphingomonas jatrophae TaxID=1166337 RepID=A0A1I6JRY1_9SPHN|nr:NAD(P)-dependent oxidoreductase [Sphingomonas jatrophae]SFR81726.1 dTDP-glucose 4,6-dehydratase [Sphingomonas jatrophae]